MNLLTLNSLIFAICVIVRDDEIKQKCKKKSFLLVEMQMIDQIGQLWFLLDSVLLYVSGNINKNIRFSI